MILIKILKLIGILFFAYIIYRTGIYSWMNNKFNHYVRVNKDYQKERHTKRRYIKKILRINKINDEI